jgi:hypothetical protein
VLRRKPDTLATDLADETILMSIERGNYYQFDGAGSDIWRRIKQPISVAALCSQLATDYAHNPDSISDDVISLLQQLAGERLLEIIE